MRLEDVFVTGLMFGFGAGLLGGGGSVSLLATFTGGVCESLPAFRFSGLVGLEFVPLLPVACLTKDSFVFVRIELDEGRAAGGGGGTCWPSPIEDKML